MHVHVIYLFIYFQEGKMVWEQELYNQMAYCCPMRFFHTFAADVGTAPLKISIQAKIQHYVKRKFSLENQNLTICEI